MKKLLGSGDSQTGAQANSWCEMFDIVSQYPVWTACHSGEQHRNIGRVPNQMAACCDLFIRWVGNPVRISQRHELTVVLYELVGDGGRQLPSVKDQILLHLVANNVGQHQLAYPSSAQR